MPPAQCGKGECPHSNKSPLGAEETTRAPSMSISVVVVPSQKLPSADNEASIENVRGHILPPMSEEWWEVRRRMLEITWNCATAKVIGKAFSSTPKGSEMTHPRSESQLMANHKNNNDSNNSSIRGALNIPFRHCAERFTRLRAYSLLITQASASCHPEGGPL